MPDMLIWMQDSELRDHGCSTAEVLAVRKLRASATQASTSSEKAKLPAKLPRWIPSAGKRPRDFLEELEIDLEIEKIPASTWPCILVKTLEGAAKKWGRREIVDKHLNWYQAKEIFIGHFLHADEALEMQAEFASIKQGPLETVREYGDRFADLMFSLGESEASVMNLYKFQRGLLQETQVNYAVAIRSKRPKDIAEAVAVAIAVEDIVSVRAKRQRPEKRCIHHPDSRSHGTEECHITLKRARSNSTAVSDKPAAIPPKTPTSVTMPPRCINHPDSRSHTTAECWGGKKPTSRVFDSRRPSTDLSKPRVVMLLSATTPEPCVTTQAGDEVNCLPGEAASSASKNPPLSVSQIQLDPTSDNPFRVPLTINGVDVLGLIDTGSSISLLNTNLVGTVIDREEVRPRAGLIRFADPSSSVSRQGCTPPLPVHCGGRVIDHEFELLPIFGDIQAIIGRDLFDQLGFTISNLPYTKPGFIPGAVPLDEEAPPGQRLTTEAADDVSCLKDFAQPLIMANQQASGVCPLPEAVIHIRVDDEEPVFIRQYKVPQAHQVHVDNQIQQWISDGIIEPIQYSSFNHPLTTSVKKDMHTGQRDGSKIRVNLDARHLNKRLPAEFFHLPIIQDIFEQLAGAKFFTALDIKGAFHCLPIAAEDRHKLAFTWSNKRYQFKRAPFGIKFVSQQFQKVMEILFSSYSHFIRVFIDDLIVFSHDQEEHKKHIAVALEILTRNGFKVSPEKCQVGFRRLFLLGHEISERGISIDKRKLLGMQEWMTPTSTNIESYLGLLNYFRSFIPQYAAITAPLEAVRKTFSWGTAQETAWNEVKRLLLAAPLLVFPNYEQEFFMATDGSRVGISAVLFQKDANGRHLYISMQSRALNPTERRYPVHKIELMAGIFGMTRFRHFLLGRRFTWYTDHRSLVWLYNDKEPNRIATSWLERFLEFDFEVIHLRGVDNILPDCLSRLYPTTSEGDEVAIPTTLNISIESDPSKDQIGSQQPADLHAFDPEPAEKERILQDIHQFGHFGANAMWQELKNRGMTWKNMMQDCVEVCKRCVLCQRHNTSRRGYHPLRPISAVLPFDHIQIDMVGPLPTTPRGANYIVTILDVATRFVILRSCMTKMAADIADILLQIIADFGTFRVLQSDNGTEFNNALILSLKEKAGFQHRFTTPYHPRANGGVEKANHTVMTTLKKFLNDATNDWDLFLPITQLAINNKIITRTATKPFELMYARKFNEFPNVQAEDWEGPSEHITQRLTQMSEVVFPALNQRTEEHQRTMKNKFDAKKHRLKEFPIGAQVMTRDQHKDSKMSPVYEGPFTIVKMTKGGSYQLIDHDKTLLPRRYAPEQLKLIALPAEANTSEETVYEVEKIISHRGQPPRYEYLVKWKHYPESENTWEPESQFNDRGVIEDYWKAQRRTPLHARKG